MSSVQDVRDAAKRDIFGKAEENVMYAKKVAQEMRVRGHSVELVFVTRKQTLANINTVVLQEEVDHLKRNKEAAFDNANARKNLLAGVEEEQCSVPCRVPWNLGGTIGI